MKRIELEEGELRTVLAAVDFYIEYLGKMGEMSKAQQGAVGKHVGVLEAARAKLARELGGPAATRAAGGRQAEEEGQG
ncbi:MAG: hypothetical protein HYV08_02700 [Deltaproteobacteria bacterium]|nr:hypothetical protein [Deltaproteobacteria bacterium]MBI3078336.1 hypothetical protein [Deltaproteobacteria bacterium]